MAAAIVMLLVRPYLTSRPTPPNEREPRDLGLAPHDAPRVHAPGGAEGGREAQLRERYPHLHHPALRVHRHRRLPDRVPGVALEVVVVDDGVALDAGRAHLELDAGEMVVVGVEEEREAVRLRHVVAPRELADDAAGLAVVEPHAHVERGVVVEKAQLRGFGRGRALAGLALHEAR